MSHRIVVIRAGRAIQLSTPDEVYTRPASRFVAKFVGETS